MIPFVSFDIYKNQPIIAAFSTKHGGVSVGDCESMNLSFKRNDDPNHVLRNHQLFAEACGYKVENVVLSDQVHETTIRYVTKSDCGKGVLFDSDIVATDGLMTDIPDVVLMTFYADCVPLYFYDTEHHAIGLAHSGWRGTVKQMGKCMVDAMNKQFGSLPQKLLAVIGPCICRDCYEVSVDVYQEFAKHFDDSFIQSIFTANEKGRYQLDLKEANRQILLQAGLLPEQIEVSGECTCCKNDVYFSHRATNGHRGNLAAVMSLSVKEGID